MAAKFITEPKADEAIDNGVAQLNVLLEAGRAPGFAIFVNNFPGHGGGPPAHHHNAYDEAFYVLAGEMEFRVDGETSRVPAGSMAFVPRAPPTRSAIPPPSRPDARRGNTGGHGLDRAHARRGPEPRRDASIVRRARLPGRRPAPWLNGHRP